MKCSDYTLCLTSYVPRDLIFFASGQIKGSFSEMMKMSQNEGT